MKPKKPITFWAAGGHAPQRGQKPPSRASVLKYLRAIEKRDSGSEVRFIQGITPRDIAIMAQKLETLDGVISRPTKKRK